jgi:hypothetical protein
MSKATYMAKVPTPNKKSMNSGLHAAKVSTLVSCFGAFPNLPVNCGTVRNKRVLALLETRDVGPFRVTGIKPALDALDAIFSQVKAHHPALYDILGTEGMCCYRKVRGGTAPSNHAAGTAIDITVGGFLPPQDPTPQTPNLIPMGFVVLYGYFHQARFFWAAGYASGTVDAMHFEASDELLKEWKAAGFI